MCAVMRVWLVVFVLGLATGLPAFGAGADEEAAGVRALAAETDEEADGNIKEYDERFPPQVEVEELQVRDLDLKAFILVEGALLLPDAITIFDVDKTTRVEIVDDDELERYEPVATFRLPEVLDLAAVVREQGEQLVRFEQRMWRQGLKLVRREYDGAGGEKVTYRAFRVEFSTTGDFYRASVTFYAPKKSVRTELAEVIKELSSVVGGLGDVRKAVDAAGNQVSAQVKGTKADVATLEKQANGLDSKLTSLEGRVSSLESKVH